MKKLSCQALLGQQGVNLLEQIVLDMGQIWRPTAEHDTGVDGEIELRDPATAEAFNRKISVQCKATEHSWESESPRGFTFRVSKADVAYWLQGNVPTILVVTRPSTTEAYWISINEYFSRQDVPSSGRIEFDKVKNRLHKDSLPHLWNLTLSPDSGIYQPPARVQEELVSNLLPVESTAEILYLAETDFRTGRDLNDRLRSQRRHGDKEWILREGRILSVHDLRDSAWHEVCERGTVEEFGVGEWRDSDDPDTQREWVQLLNKCLTQKLFPHGVRIRYDGGRFLHFFGRDVNRDSRKYSYQSLENRTSREVVRKLKVSKTEERFCYRHAAMLHQFHRFNQQWYLEVTPTYFYTVDGHEVYRYQSDQLAGIKRLEKNAAVLGQLIMWQQLLTQPAELFRNDYPYLRFGSLRRFHADRGLLDELWLPTTEGTSVLEDDLQHDEGMLF